MINHKQSILNTEKPHCLLHRISLDLADRKARLSLFKQPDSQTNKALIVSEGLIGYLDEEEVGTLASDLSTQKSFHHWVLDLMSPGLLVMAQENMGDVLRQANAPLKFAPEAGEEFFTAYGWRPVESKSKLKTAAVLKRLSEEMMAFAGIPEPEGPKGPFPWSGVCLFENIHKG